MRRHAENERRGSRAVGSFFLTALVVNTVSFKQPPTTTSPGTALPGKRNLPGGDWISLTSIAVVVYARQVSNAKDSQPYHR